jgi:hypothetical protein
VAELGSKLSIVFAALTLRRWIMKSGLTVACAVALAAFVSVSGAEAKGCIRGALVGGVAGHVAGHHGLLGAAAGCVIGRHEAHKHDATNANARAPDQK